MTRPSGRRRPLLLAMAGLPGTSKSTCADRIANDLRVSVIDKDDLLEHVRLLDRGRPRTRPPLV
ncbi:MAG: hypothetical protein ACR2H2_14765 [Solirubrobacteraceae bacterium]